MIQHLSIYLTVAAGFADEQPLSEQVNAILHTVDGAKEPASDLARRIAFLGSEALPAVLGALESGTGCGLSYDDGSGQLSPGQIEVLYESLSMSSRSALLPLLEERAGNEPCPRVVLGVLAHIGRGEDIALGLKALEPNLTFEFEDAVTRILERDGSAFVHLKDHIREQTPDNASTLVRAAGATHSYAGLQMMLDLLGLDPGLDRVLLTHIGRIGQAAPWHVSEREREIVRSYLGAEDSQTLRGVLYAVGGLGDHAAVETIIGLLSSESRSVREAAHWALKSITGLGLSADPNGWVSWHATESNWYDRHARTLFGQCATSSPRGIADALKELSMRRYRRVTISEEVQALLAHPDAYVRRSACRALGSLQSGVAVPALLATMADNDEAVALEAWTALKAVTGKEQPFDIEAWSRELQGSHFDRRVSRRGRAATQESGWSRRVVCSSRPRASR